VKEGGSEKFFEVGAVGRRASEVRGGYCNAAECTFAPSTRHVGFEEQGEVQSAKAENAKDSF